MVLTYKQLFNKKYKQKLDQPNSLEDISKLTGYKFKGIKTIFEKAEGAFETAGASRPNMQKQQWAYARVYSSVNPKSKSNKIDKIHLKKK